MAEPIVTTGKSEHMRKSRRWQFVLLVVGVILLAGGAGAGVRWWLASRGDQAVADQPALHPALQEVEDLSLSGDEEGAEQKMASALADPSTPPEVKYSLYLQQGAARYAKQDYEGAAESYGGAFAIRKTFEAAQALASTYQQLGDKQQAISYLRQAIELVPQDNPVRDDEIRVIQQQIEALEAGE